MATTPRFSNWKSQECFLFTLRVRLQPRRLTLHLERIHQGLDPDVCCTVHEGHERPTRGCSQRCEHPGIPGASSVCNYGFLSVVG
eukprot:2642415-Pyramimonas_sp.AAC.1